MPEQFERDLALGTIRGDQPQVPPHPESAATATAADGGDIQSAGLLSTGIWLEG